MPHVGLGNHPLSLHFPTSTLFFSIVYFSYFPFLTRFIYFLAIHPFPFYWNSPTLFSGLTL